MLTLTKGRTTALAVALAAVTAVASITPAEARGWRRHGGGALALGIGALVVGSLLHRHHYRHRYYAYEPSYGYYSYESRRAHKWRHHHHRHRH